MFLSFTNILIATGFIFLFLLFSAAWLLKRLSTEQKRQWGKTIFIISQILLLLIQPFFIWIDTACIPLFGGGESAEAVAVLIIFLSFYIFVPATYLMLLVGCINYFFIKRTRIHKISGIALIFANLAYIFCVYINL